MIRPGQGQSLIHDHSIHGSLKKNKKTKKKTVNPLWAKIHRFLWRSMIQVILNLINQTNEPFNVYILADTELVILTL